MRAATTSAQDSPFAIDSSAAMQRAASSLVWPSSIRRSQIPQRTRCSAEQPRRAAVSSRIRRRLEKRAGTIIRSSLLADVLLDAIAVGRVAVPLGTVGQSAHVLVEASGVSGIGGATIEPVVASPLSALVEVLVVNDVLLVVLVEHERE